MLAGSFRIVYLAFVTTAIVADKSSETRLYTDLFSGYNQYIRPGGDSGKILQVEMKLSLHRISYVQAETQTMKNFVVITAEWVEPILSWNPSNYGNVGFMVVPASTIWLPDFGIRNSADNFYDTTASVFRLEINHSGKITWPFADHVETKCKIVVEKFPFDQQICNFSLINWMYDESAVKLELKETKIDISEYVKNVEWDLLDTKCERSTVVKGDRDGRSYSCITCKMLLSRRPTFYIVNLFLPSYLVLVLFLLSFWLPPGNRATIPLQLTTLLIFSVLLLNISSKLPHTSHIPHITSFVIAVIAIATLSVVFTAGISMIRIYMKSTLRVPRLLRVIAFDYLAIPLCLKTLLDDLAKEIVTKEADNVILLDKDINEYDVDDEKIESHVEEDLNRENTLLSGILKNTNQARIHLKQIENNTKGNPCQERIAAEWDLCSKVLARSCFWLFLLSVLALSVEFALAEASQSKLKL